MIEEYAEQPSFNLQCETLVVGGGIAGCWTALKLAERGMDTVLLCYQDTDRGGRLGATNLSVGAISIAPITRPDYGNWLDELGRGQVQTSVGQVTVDYLAEEIECLKKFDPLKKIELGFALASGSGKKLVQDLFAHLRNLGVRIIENAWVVRIEASENECRGVQFQQGTKSGVISASSIVLANGGYSGLFHGAVKTGTYGSLHARFLQAGGRLSNLEFVFKHGYGQPDLGKLTPTEELPGVEIYDDEGSHVMWLEEELFYGRGTHNHFQAFMTWRKDESKKYFVDFRYCDFHRFFKKMLIDIYSNGLSQLKLYEQPLEKYIDTGSKFAFLTWLNKFVENKSEYTFSDFNQIKPFLRSLCHSDKHRIRQIAYFSMGGIMHHGFVTNLKNVFVNGEAMHDYGAHRVGGLPWALYLCAARKIADDVVAIKQRIGMTNLSVSLIDQVSKFDGELLEEIQIKLFDFQERGKDESTLKQFLQWLKSKRLELQEQQRTLDDGYAYLLLAEAIVQSSIARKESRGCFFRSDFLNEDYRYARSRTIASYDDENDCVRADCIDKSNILDLVFNRNGEKEKWPMANEKNNAAYALLKKHLTSERREAVAIEHEELKLTYNELNAKVERYAYFLFSQGLNRGDRVVIHLRDSPDWAAIFLACLQLGLIAVPLNTFAKEKDILYFLEDSKAEILISEKALLSELHVELLSNRQVTRIFTLEDICPLQEQTLSICVPVNKNTPCLILYTSGSTGKPKGAVHSHTDFTYTAEHFARDCLKPQVDDRFYSSSRMFFAYGLGNSFIFPLYFGCTSVITSNRLSPKETIDFIAEKCITHFFSIPAIYSSMVATLEQNCVMDSLKLFISAGELLSPNIAKKLVGKVGKPLIDGIGSTEALHIFCCNYYYPNGDSIIGKVVDGYSLQLLDDNNFAIKKASTPANLAVEGGSLASCYWNNSEATKQTFINNLLITGDRYMLNEKGEFIYLGRNGDMYKSSGLWVSAVEIETALKELNYVKDAAVCVFIDSTGTQKSAAFVIPADNQLTPSDLHKPALFREQFSNQTTNDLENKISKYKLPNFIFISRELPRTATGKVAKAELKEIARIHELEISSSSNRIADTEVV
jgi:4-hydroxybenzoate adenylyltransferase